jgi:uncharacterized membrane protein
MAETAVASSELPGKRTSDTNADNPTQRVASIDILRGMVMVLMAIDHVRVFSGLPAGGPTPGIFFTRWITHFCAPWFIFFAGTSAFLRNEKLGDKAAMSRYLATRGLMLVFLELTVLRLAWTFNFDYAHYMLAGVIWVIGWCMVLMAALIWLPTRVVGIIGVVIIFGHNIADPFLPRVYQTLGQGSFDWFWQILYLGGGVQLGKNGPTLAVLYVIIPWIGVMAAGYWFGCVLRMRPDRRDRICYLLGFASIAAFLVLRGWNLYGNPTHWGGPNSKLPPLLAFLNTAKYPAALQFLLMTLGPAFVLAPLAERLRGFAARVFTLFGRVPFFYYLLHIPLIHAAAIVVSIARTGRVDPWLFANHPMFNPPPPQGYTWSLGLLYAVWLAVVVMLYFACSWYAGRKPRANMGNPI